jgi:hypothetical protein
MLQYLWKELTLHRNGLLSLSRGFQYLFEYQEQDISTKYHVWQVVIADNHYHIWITLTGTNLSCAISNLGSNCCVRLSNIASQVPRATPSPILNL